MSYYILIPCMIIITVTLILSVTNLASTNISEEINNLDCGVLKDRIDNLYYHNYLNDAKTEYETRCNPK